jgi:acetylornithine deacetylase/succinyl-diaminopimelate desuccinylase-like protein
MIDVIELAQRLIRVPSPVHDGDERAVAALIQETLETLSLPTAQVLALEPTRPNLVTTIDFGPGGRHLALVGHIDTKPIADGAWTVDPFGADIDGDRLYGLGSADMKAAVAAMLLAAAAAVGSGLGAGRLSLVFTADEEDGAVFGAKYLADTLDLDADALVIGEPSGVHDDFDRVPIVSRGLGRFRITAQAKQGHSSLASLLGMRNAGVDLARAIVAVADGFRPTIPVNVDDLPDWNAAVNAGLDIGGGYGYGVLPERMSATIEVRTLPGMRAADTLDDLRRFVSTIAERDGSRLEVEVDGDASRWIDGTSVAADDAIVSSIVDALDVAIGTRPPLAVFPGTTDTSWFAGADPALPCIPSLGPGLLRHCHAADEWVSVAATRSTVPIYTELIRRFCAGTAEGSAA